MTGNLPKYDHQMNVWFFFFFFLTVTYSSLSQLCWLPISNMLYFCWTLSTYQAHFSCLVSAVVDTNDRFLRKVTVGQASTETGHSRQVRVRATTPPCSREASWIRWNAYSRVALSACSRFLCLLAACQRLSEIMAPKPNPANKQCAPQWEPAWVKANV